MEHGHLLARELPDEPLMLAVSERRRRNPGVVFRAVSDASTVRSPPRGSSLEWRRRPRGSSDLALAGCLLRAAGQDRPGGLTFTVRPHSGILSLSR
jgi:hypothetical protein